MPMLGLTELIVLLSVAVLVVVVIRLLLSRSSWTLQALAEAMGLTLTERSAEYVDTYIRRTRTLRVLGAVVGCLGPVIWSAYRQEGAPAPFDNTLLTGLVGYLLGAVAAELTFKRPRGESATATLAPRELHQYLPETLTKTMRVCAVTTALLLPVYLMLPARNERMGTPQLIGWVLAPLLIWFVIEMLQRYIVRRPQPMGDADLVDADDAIRSLSVHALAGAGIALELMMVGGAIFAISFVTDVQILRWTFPWLGVAAMGAALGSWLHLTRPERWRVNRLTPGSRA